ncbi:MAG TPA: hypothetical protein VLB84_14585, partial [Bacteroidia bacterium]|nr:hypothetical protein [Bacteroidia bacterium]
MSAVSGIVSTLNHYVSNNDCVKSLNDFVKEELLKIDFSGCEPPLDCEESCVLEMGTEADYLAANPGKTHTDYLREKLACELECKAPPSINVMYAALLADVSPGGQYAQFDSIVSTGELVPRDVTSIFHPSNVLGADLSNPAIEFKDENGDPAEIVMPGGSSGTPNQLFAASLTEFIKQWQPSWAKSIVKYHPEYKYYLTYNTGVGVEQASIYETLMMHTETYEEALKLGLLNPMNFADVPVPVSTDANTNPLPFIPANLGEPHMDPFFSDLGASDFYLLPMTDYVKNFTLVKNGSSVKGIWQIAAVAAVCNNPDIPDAASCAAACSTYVFSPIELTDPCTIDRVWKMFRSLYLAKRKILFDQMIEHQAVFGLGGNSNHDIGASGDFADKVKRFPLMTDELELKFGTGILSSDPTDVDNNMVVAQTNMKEQCEEQCEEYADIWLIKLNGCNPLATPWDSSNAIYNELREKLIDVCKLGCDENHPLGASSVATGSTGVPSGRPGVANYKSFSDVVKGILGEETLECSSNLINTPVPYTNDFTIATGVIPADTCACDKILYVDKLYNGMVAAHTLPAGMTKSALFEKTYNVSLEELNVKVC